MKVKLIFQIVLFLLFLLFMGMFIFENFEPVRIWIPFLTNRQCSLIIIIGISYLIGASNMFWVMVHFGSLMKRKQQAAAEQEEDGELFQDEE